VTLMSIHGAKGLEFDHVFVIDTDEGSWKPKAARYPVPISLPIHTNLDNVIHGVSGKMAEVLGLQNVQILSGKQGTLAKLYTFVPIESAEEVRKAIFEAGGGNIGNYSECSFNSEGNGTFKAEEGAEPYVGEIGKRQEEKETKIEIVYPAYLEQQVVKALIDNHPYEEVAYDIFTMENVHYGIGSGIIGTLAQPMDEGAFLKKLKDVFHCSVIKHTALLGKPVQKVAVCGGAGSFLTKKALQQGAD